MINRFLFVILISTSLTHSFDKAVYGEDDRVEYSQVSQKLKRSGDATAAMISKKSLKSSGKHYLFSSKILGEQIMGNQFRNGYLCSDERFFSQEILATCTGFLVSGNRLVTAGHCITGAKSCKNNLWSFGLSKDKSRSGKILKSETYSCKKVIKRSSGQLDYAVIELDRAVRGITPMEISSKSPRKGDLLIAIGHPSRLPLKFSLHGEIKKISKNSYKTDLDTFAGNSGSPILLKSTLEVIGILVKGATDYTMDMERGCFVVNKCSEYASGVDCYGESVTPISRIGITL